MNYRDSPLSVSKHTSGSLRAGDRVPNLQVEVVGSEGKVIQSPVADKLFRALDIDGFTLLCTSLRDAGAMHLVVQKSLSPWKAILRTVSMRAAAGSEQTFHDTFGASPSLVLVRPDGYASFVGSEDSFDSLKEYLARWFTQSKPALEKGIA